MGSLPRFTPFYRVQGLDLSYEVPHQNGRSTCIDAEDLATLDEDEIIGSGIMNFALWCG